MVPVFDGYRDAAVIAWRKTPSFGGNQCGCLRDKWPVCRQVYSMAAGKLSQLDQRIDELVELRGQLQALMTQWASRLDQTPDGHRAGLLEVLIQPPFPKGPTT